MQRFEPSWDALNATYRVAYRVSRKQSRDSGSRSKQFFPFPIRDSMLRLRVTNEKPRTNQSAARAWRASAGPTTTIGLRFSLVIRRRKHSTIFLRRETFLRMIPRISHLRNSIFETPCTATCICSRYTCTYYIVVCRAITGATVIAT